MHTINVLKEPNLPASRGSACAVTLTFDVIV
jgi:hypothetical protein